ncbi:MAG: hypothetical protein QM635_11425 [Microbacteriaceae bacterium]
MTTSTKTTASVADRLKELSDLVGRLDVPEMSTDVRVVGNVAEITFHASRDAARLIGAVQAVYAYTGCAPDMGERKDCCWYEWLIDGIPVVVFA